MAETDVMPGRAAGRTSTGGSVAPAHIPLNILRRSSDAGTGRFHVLTHSPDGVTAGKTKRGHEKSDESPQGKTILCHNERLSIQVNCDRSATARLDNNQYTGLIHPVMFSPVCRLRAMQQDVKRRSKNVPFHRFS